MNLRDRVELLSQKVEARKQAGVRARLLRRLGHLFQLLAEGRPLPPGPRYPQTPERQVLLERLNDPRAWARLMKQVARANGWQEPVTITVTPQWPQLQAPAPAVNGSAR